MKIDKEAIDGRVDAPKNLYDALGLAGKGLGLYNTGDIKEYEKELKAMNTVDLQAHCIKVGIRPNAEKSALIEKLKREFRSNASSYKGAMKSKRRDSKPQLDEDKRKKALDIMKGV